ncbi:MAG TPA: ABC transporter substrate-binding protein [Burkholderiaceae bacterium]|nr:ABC transporter substrate-binding protein [Burkholderiaceae bacterium]
MSLLRLSLAIVVIAVASSANAQIPADAPKKIFRYAFEVAETGFDPAQISDLYSRSVANNIFDAPLRYAYLAKPGTVVPNTAAELPTASADFKTFTFKIRQGIYFADDPAFKGNKRELTAADYVYSLKRHFDPRWKSPSYGGLEVLDILGMRAIRDDALKTGKFDYDREAEGLRTLGRYTFQIKLGRPNPRFASDLTDGSVVGAVAREVVEFYGDKIMEHPVGTGPFRLSEWRRSSRIVLERNPNYRDNFYDVEPDPSDASAVEIAQRLKGRKLPLIDRVEIDIVEESQPRWLAFLNGEHDHLERLTLDLSPIALPNGKPSPTLQKKGVTVERVPVIDYTFAVYNMEHPVIGGYTPEKIALRRALNLAINTNELISTAYKYQAFPAHGPIMPMTYGYDPRLRTEMGETDPARANALLDTYGYIDRDGDGWRDRPDGSPLVIEFSTQPDQRARINDEIWKKSLDAIRVRMSFKVAKWPEQLRFARNGQFMVWSLGLSAGSPDSAGSFRQLYGPSAGAENLSRFKLKEYDQLYREQDELPNGAERLAKLREMQKIIIAYAPQNYLVHRYAIDMDYPWVQNYRRWPFVRDWWRYVDIDTDQQRQRIRK